MCYIFLDDIPNVERFIIFSHLYLVQTLCWNGDRAWLFSGSFDSAVFIWDIGGRKGTVYELHGHRNKVTGVRYSDRKKAIFSFSEDTQMVEWDLSINRIEVKVLQELKSQGD